FLHYCKLSSYSLFFVIFRSPPLFSLFPSTASSPSDFSVLSLHDALPILLSGAVYPVSEVVGGKIVTKTVPALTALNERLRDDYIDEIADGVRRWQRVIDQAGIPFRLTLPHKGFHREIGNFAGLFISPEGEALTEEAWKK